MQPLLTSEPVDAKGAPYALLNFSAEEWAFNAASGRADHRIALWPSSVISNDPSGGLVFYTKLVVNPGDLNYEFVGTGLARLASGATTAARDPELLFNYPEPLFDKATLLGSTVYLYGLLPRSQDVGVARVPLSQVGDRRAYRFWNGSQWDSEAGATRALFGGVPGAVTVSHNVYLDRYLAVHSEVMSNRVVMRTAERPEGPWSNPVLAFAGQAPASGVDYAGREHPELTADGGRRIFVSYYRRAGGFRGELRLVEVTLR
ncbi:MAG TPA: DUF4185 domain-containing protein [Vicinamibacteria bacterium]|nr:DUF4185 domain-containing protein [Vicinamibacteria bacterium]